MDIDKQKASKRASEMLRTARRDKETAISTAEKNEADQRIKHWSGILSKLHQMESAMNFKDFVTLMETWHQVDKHGNVAKRENSGGIMSQHKDLNEPSNKNRNAKHIADAKKTADALLNSKEDWRKHSGHLLHKDTAADEEGYKKMQQKKLGLKTVHEETLTELSTKTLERYVPAAKKSMADEFRKGDNKAKNIYDEDGKKHYAKALKREDGIVKAKEKLNELSTDTLKSYKRKRKYHNDKREDLAGRLTNSKKYFNADSPMQQQRDNEVKDLSHKVAKGKEGIQRAKDKIAKKKPKK